MEWISVNDRLPTMHLVRGEDGDDDWLSSYDYVLIWDGSKTRMANAVFTKKLEWVTEGGDAFSADFWMPLPTMGD